MSSSLLNGEWSAGILYKITLNTVHMEACLYGFRGVDQSQLRFFKNQDEIDRYVGELWFLGMDDVTIEQWLDT